MTKGRRGALNTGSQHRRKRLLRIAERDKWVCQLCLEPVDPSLRGKVNHPMAPSLDHIVPHYQGGDSKDSNLQLAHIDCNSKQWGDPNQI
jgi:5-methylcytosine-specific restriction endonuclease McrA